MVITQAAQVVKIFYLYSTRNLFKLSFRKLIIFINVLLVSCTSYSMQAEEIKPENLNCGSSSAFSFFEKNGSLIYQNADFEYKLKFFDKSLTKEDFNFIYISKPQNSGGYILEVEKIIKKKNKHLIYFKENKPPRGSINTMAISATYCFLKIKDLNRLEVIVK